MSFSRRSGGGQARLINESSHDHEWYNPSWMVNPFPWGFVEHFNRLVIARDYPRELTTALVRLEEASRRFHDMLADQIEYLRSAPADIGARWGPVVDAAKAKGSQLSAKDLAKIAGLTEEDRPYLTELYRRNKETHVSGIGGPGGDGLHEACRAASEHLVVARTELQAGRDTRWSLVGHGVAILFTLLGALFLFDFGWSLADLIQHRRPTSTSAPTDSAGARANTSQMAKPDSTKAATH